MRAAQTEPLLALLLAPRWGGDAAAPRSQVQPARHGEVEWDVKTDSGEIICLSMPDYLPESVLTRPLSLL